MGLLAPETPTYDGYLIYRLYIAEQTTSLNAA